MTNRKSSRAFQQAIDGVRTLPLRPQRMAQNPIFLVFRDKIQFQSNKVCYKVLLCEIFHRENCFTTILLLEVFKQRNFVADFIRLKLMFIRKNETIVF